MGGGKGIELGLQALVGLKSFEFLLKSFKSIFFFGETASLELMEFIKTL